MLSAPLASCASEPDGLADQAAAPVEIVEAVETMGCSAENEMGIPYSIIRVDDGFTEIYAINDDGVMAGNLSRQDDAQRAFVLDHDRQLDVFTLNGQSALVEAINERGEVAGRSGYLPEASTAFVRSRDGDIREFPIADLATISSITRSGLVAGHSEILGRLIGFTHSADDITVSYPLDTTYDVRMAVVNDDGRAAGTLDGPGGKFEGFVIQPNGATSTFRVHDVRATVVVDMNAAGDITGQYQDEELLIWRGFVMTASGELVSFDIDGRETVPTSINDAGEIAGEFVTSAPGEDLTRAAFFRKPTGATVTVTIPGVDDMTIEELNNQGIAVGHTSIPTYNRRKRVGFVIAFGSTCTVSEPAANPSENSEPED